MPATSRSGEHFVAPFRQRPRRLALEVEDDDVAFGDRAPGRGDSRRGMRIRAPPRAQLLERRRTGAAARSRCASTSRPSSRRRSSRRGSGASEQSQLLVRMPPHGGGRRLDVGRRERLGGEGGVVRPGVRQAARAAHRCGGRAPPPSRDTCRPPRPLRAAARHDGDRSTPAAVGRHVGQREPVHAFEVAAQLLDRDLPAVALVRRRTPAASRATTRPVAAVA